MRWFGAAILRGKTRLYIMLGVITAALSLMMLSGAFTTPVSPSESAAAYSAKQQTGGSKRMTKVGINLGYNTYYGKDFPFIDRIKTINPWTAIMIDPQAPRHTAPTDANGYPVQEAGVYAYQALVPLEPASAGQSKIFHLYYDGDATMQVNGAKVLSQKPGELIVDMTDANGLLTMVPSPGGKLPTKINLVRDDHVALFKAGEIFNPTFLEKLDSFSELRLMDWTNTNSSTIKNWSDRTTPDDMTWGTTGTTDGVPLEIQVALANKLNTNIWINIPHEATDDYVTKALTYVRDNLKAGLTVKVEYSNEVWNWSFGQSRYALQKSLDLWGPVDDNPMQYYGYRSAQVAAITKQVFSGQTAVKAQAVISTQTGWLGRENFVFQGVARANAGTVNDLFDVYAVTNYWGTQLAGGTAADKAKILGWASSGKAGLDAAFAEIENGGGLSTDTSLKATLGWLEYQARVAKAQGLSLQIYESGVDLVSEYYTEAERAIIQPFFKAILADQRIGDQYNKALAGFTALGGEQWDAYKAFGEGGKSGEYGALDGVYDKGSVRFDTLVAAAQAAGSAALPTKPTLVSLPPVLADIPVAPAGISTEVLEPVKPSVDPVPAATTTAPPAPLADVAAATIGNALNNVLKGGGSADALSGLAGDDSLFGGAGDDTLDGGLGDDLLDGGAGDDVYVVDSGADVVTEGANAGIDEVKTTIRTYELTNNVEKLTFLGAESFTGIGNGLDNVIVGGNGGNTLWGNGGSDTLKGGDGADLIDGGEGADRLYGGKGGDRYFVDAKADLVVEDEDAGDDRVDTTIDYVLPDNVENLNAASSAGLSLTGNALANVIEGASGKDWLYGLDGNDVLLGREGADTIFGGEGDDTIGGAEGGDVLNGGFGKDTVYGGDGDDILTGGGGCDVLNGGAGADTFLVCDGDVSNVLANTLTIADFSRGDRDKIDFRGFDANVNKAGVNPFDFIGTRKFSKKAGELRTENGSGGWILQGDTNGDGVADFSVMVSTKMQLLKTDFVL